jgi:ABC-2 type transport system ATP-binding protein
VTTTTRETESPAESPRDTGDPFVLEVREAEKRFGERRVLCGVSLAIRRGEILALLGPNGAGKTTLVRAICGRVVLDAGTVRIADQDPVENPKAREALGLVPQEIALYHELTARENLEILGRLAGVPRREIAGAVRQALAWTGLEERSGDRAGSLSGGMQRRLNIAAGTLHRPTVLLLDEPTVGVDPVARQVIHEVLDRVRRAGMAILLTTHDMEQAEELADRIAILAGGKICAEGTLADLVREQFADARELTITVTEPPGGEARSLLESLGLKSVSEETIWTGRLAGGLGDLSGLGDRLKAAGISVAEVRVREPGLRGVFFRVTGQEFES